MGSTTEYSYWTNDWTAFKEGKPTGWNLTRLSKALSEVCSEEEIEKLTIIIWDTEYRGKEIPNKVVLSADIMILDGVLIKDRVGLIN